MSNITHNEQQQGTALEGLHYAGLFHTWAVPPLLDSAGSFTVSMRVSNLVIGKMRIVVRDANHHDLCSGGMGDGVPPLSTGNADIAWTCAPAALAAPRYVIWNLWAEYNGADERTFEAELTLAQDDMRWICRVPGTMPAGGQVMHLTPGSDYVFIGAAA